MKKRILFTCARRIIHRRPDWFSVLAMIVPLWLNGVSAGGHRTCPLDSTARIESGSDAYLTSPTPSVRLDRQCYVSARRVLTIAHRRGSLLVDIRDARAFARAHIERSINIPAREIASKQFLRNKEIVLVGAGPSHRELERSCAELRALGLRSVHVLEGGLSRWRATIGPLEGTDPQDPLLDEITVTEYISERRYDHWLEVVVTSLAKGSVTVGANALIVPTTLEHDEFVLQIHEISRTLERDKGLEAHILVVHDHSKEGRAFVQAARRDGLNNVYSLKGGAVAWSEFTRMQTAMARHVPRSGRLESCAN